MRPSPCIAVISAAIAVLACASAPVTPGAAVTVLEKGRGPGGRMSTRRGDGCLNGGKVENAWHSSRQLAHRVARSFG